MFIARYWVRDREGPYFFDLKLKWDYNQPLLFMNIILNFKFSVLLKRIASKRLSPYSRRCLQIPFMSVAWFFRFLNAQTKVIIMRKVYSMKT